MEPETYALVKRTILSLLNIDLEHYKDEQMKRRLDSWLVRSGSASWPDYIKRLRAEEMELGRLRDYLTINVSTFFRDPERWELLRKQVIPELLRTASGPRLRIWSAGCSIGLEPYSLAIMMDELTPGRTHSLLATDLDRGALAKARAGGPYSAEDVQNVSAGQRTRHFRAGGPPFFVNDKLIKQVEFREQNMVQDSFEGGFDLIVCRNVVIYFTEAAKAELYRKFCQALRPGGILFVGGTEVVSRAQDLGYRSFGVSFYQRV